jgi:hypothetical protein
MSDLLARRRALVAAINSGGFTSEYKAILDYANSQSWTLPTLDCQKLQDKYIRELKSKGIWNKIDLLHQFTVDNSATDFTRINWKNPGSNNGASTNLTFTNKEGYKGNGTNGWWATNYNANTQGVNFQLNDASRFWYKNEALSGNQRIDGTEGVTGQNTCTNDNTVAQRINQGTSNLDGGISFNTIGFQAIIRISNTLIRAYTDNVYDIKNSNSSSVPNGNIQVFRTGTNFSTNNMGLYGAGGSLTEQNCIDFQDIHQNYLTELALI